MSLVASMSLVAPTARFAAATKAVVATRRYRSLAAHPCRILPCARASSSTRAPGLPMVEPRALLGAKDVFSSSSFTEYGLDTRLLRGVEVSIGQDAFLTQVQASLLPALLAQERPDLLMRAHTGTGKTLAFLVPAIQRLLEAQARGEGGDGVRMVVLAPSRELVLQLARVARQLLQHAGIDGPRSSFVCAGFTEAEDLLRLQADRPHLLLATPGRLLQHIQRTPNFIKAFGSVDLLVLDEADQLLSDHFVHQVDYVIRCLSPSSKTMQTVLCSATFSEPVRRFAARTLRAKFRTLDLAEADVSAASVIDERSGRGEVVENVEQLVVRYRPDSFFAVLAHILQNELVATGTTGKRPRALVVFPTVRWLQFAYVLLKHQGGFRGLFALHRHLSDDKRRARVALFTRKGVGSECHSEATTAGFGHALFASDLATRGLDLDVDVVVQIGPPHSREQYVHRAGRTGRLDARGRSVLLLHELEEAIVLHQLAGLGISEGGSRYGVVDGGESLPTPEALKGWWEDKSLLASSSLFFSSAVAYYCARRELFRATPTAILNVCSKILESTGMPKEMTFPNLPPGLSRQLLDLDPNCGVRKATVRQRWEVLSAMPSYPGFRSRSSGVVSSAMDAVSSTA